MGVEIVDLGGDLRILYAVPLTSVPSLSKVAMRSGAGTKSGDLFLIIIMIEEAAQHRPNNERNVRRSDEEREIRQYFPHEQGHSSCRIARRALSAERSR